MKLKYAIGTEIMLDLLGFCVLYLWGAFILPTAHTQNALYYQFALFTGFAAIVILLPIGLDILLQALSLPYSLLVTVTVTIRIIGISVVTWYLLIADNFFGLRLENIIIAGPVIGPEATIGAIILILLASKGVVTIYVLSHNLLRTE